MRYLLTIVVCGLLGAANCGPEYKLTAIEGGYLEYAAGGCFFKQGREVGLTCVKAEECSLFCCECPSKDPASPGAQYTAAVCMNGKCSDVGESCRAAETNVCK